MRLRITIGINLILSQAELILTLERVEYPEARELGHDFLIRTQVNIYDVEGAAEHYVAEDQNHEEGANAYHRLLDQSDEESRFIKQTKPIENLQPQEAYSDGWKGDLPVLFEARDVDNHDVDVYEQVDQVVDVPIVEEVIWPLVTVLPLNILAESLVHDEDKAIAEQRVVNDMVSFRMLNVLLERVD